MEMTELRGADYKIVERDDSVRNENGDILTRISYQQVVLLGDSPAYAAINAQIEEDCRDWLENCAARYYSKEDMKQVMAKLGLGYGSLFAVATARVAHNADGIISIRITTEWFMGSIHQTLVYGLTYYLANSAKAELRYFLWAPAGDGREQLREIACRHLEAVFGDALTRNPWDVLYRCSVSDYDYYVENGEIVLVLANYRFVSEAAGATEIHTGWMV